MFLFFSATLFPSIVYVPGKFVFFVHCSFCGHVHVQAAVILGQLAPHCEIKATIVTSRITWKRPRLVQYDAAIKTVQYPGSKTYNDTKNLQQKLQNHATKSYLQSWNIQLYLKVIAIIEYWAKLPENTR